MKRRQTGAQLVEFALVGGVFFTVLFGVLVFAYWFHLLDTLTEAVRRGARVAVVCPKYSQNIYLATVFAPTATTLPGDAGNEWPTQIRPATTYSTLLPQLTTDMVTVTYTTVPANVGGVAETVGGFYDTVRTVKVAIGDDPMTTGVIEAYEFSVNMPVLGKLGFAFPIISATLPVESMGRTSLDPDKPARSCLMP